MRQTRPEEEPLLPPWIMKLVLILGPLAVVVGIYWLMTAVLRVPGKISAPVLAVLTIALAVYLGGRLYKPFYVNKEGRCIARGAKQRAQCRHFIAGARLGGGCGRLREDGRCRYVR